MAQAGRKSWVEELHMAQRYADLSPKAFKVLNTMLDSDDKNDQKWAVEQLGKAFVKMIPQDITSGGKELPTPIFALNEIRRDNSTTEDSETE